MNYRIAVIERKRQPVRTGRDNRGINAQTCPEYAAGIESTSRTHVKFTPGENIPEQEKSEISVCERIEKVEIYRQYRIKKRTQRLAESDNN